MTSPPKPRRSIRAQLDRLVLISVGATLLLVSGLTVWHEANRYLASKQETLFATAQAFGAAISRGLAAKDADAVLQGLRAVARVPGLLRAEAFDAGGSLLAELGGAVRLGGDLDLDETAGQSLLHLLRSRTVQVAVPVVDGGERVGRLLLVSDTEDLPARLRDALLVPAAGSGLALLAGLALSRRLQRRITQPLARLTAAMANVEHTKVYAPVTGIDREDETGLLAAGFNSMIAEIDRATAEIIAREDEIIERLSRAGEQRDDQTGQHVVRVARISRLIADRLDLDPAYVDDLCRASPMHDVGKISIPDVILFKPGRLNVEERRQMERHAEAGYQVLAGSKSKLVQLAAEIAISHHERWDGGGYPRGLSGSAIPLPGRITAVADVCDALLSERPYKKAWTLEQVREHLLREAGTHFDPACVQALIERWHELEAIYEAPKTPVVSQAA